MAGLIFAVSVVCGGIVFAILTAANNIVSAIDRQTELWKSEGESIGRDDAS